MFNYENENVRKRRGKQKKKWWDNHTGNRAEKILQLQANKMNEWKQMGGEEKEKNKEKILRREWWPSRVDPVNALVSIAGHIRVRRKQTCVATIHCVCGQRECWQCENWHQYMQAWQKAVLETLFNQILLYVLLLCLCVRWHNEWCGLCVFCVRYLVERLNCLSLPLPLSYSANSPLHIPPLKCRAVVV